MMRAVALGLLFLVGVAESQVPKNEPVPSFPDVYKASGIIRLPYAEIDEPFEAWYDAKHNRSRIDYYDGTMKTYVRGDESEYGLSREVNPYTKDSIHIETLCIQEDGNENVTVTIQGVLPDLQGFQYIGQKTFQGKLCDVWENVTMGESKVNTYRFWASKDSDIVVPIRYEMLGYDTLFSSHYDKYELIYNSFNAVDSIDVVVFDLEANLECQNFSASEFQGPRIMNPMGEFVLGNDAHVHEMFQDFKTTYNKNYENEVEHSKRKTNFLHNLRFVNSHNRAGRSYRVALNHMADWSDDEATQIRGRRSVDSEASHDGLSFDPSDYNVSALPEFLDWRYYGAVTPVKDQAICGSCWSFATVGVVEGAYFMKMKTLPVLSEQALVDCSWVEGNYGCGGGEDFASFRWIKEKGVPKSYAYGPYLGINGLCHHQNISKEDLVYITDYVNVTSRNVEHLKLALVNNGPVAVTIDASPKTFRFYSNGVYDEPTCKTGVNDTRELDHIVVAVGYGVLGQDKKPYWLLKNSWSTYWGNDGYMLMSHTNDCGVTSYPTYVTL